MPLPPSRRDITGPPPSDVTDLRFPLRHHDSYLRSLDPGILGGRWITPRPNPYGPSQIVGDDGGGDGGEREWQWEDRYTVAGTGTQIVHLTYEPVEESLFVFWHADGRGGTVITNEHFTVDGNVVTIPDPGFLVVGDQFSFQYQFEEWDDAPEKLASLTLRDISKVDSNTVHTLPTLPALTEVGDFVVIVSAWADAGSGTVTCTDGRFVAVGDGTHSNMWIGRADSLAALSFSNDAFRSCFAVAAFVEQDVQLEVSANATASDVTTLAAPVVVGSAAVAGIMDAHDVTTGSGNLDDTPWTQAVTTINGLLHAAIFYWVDGSAAATPTGDASFNGGSGPRVISVASVQA